MQGRLFEGSASIYDDEARILFDYFSKAADDIIKKEDEVQGSIDEAKAALAAQKKRRNGNKVLSLFMILLCIAASVACYVYFGIGNYLYAALGVTAVVILVSIISMVKSAKQVKYRLSALEQCEEDFKEIRRDYRVKRLGVAYVPIAKKVPFGNQNVTVDLSGSVSEETFELVTMNDPDTFEKDADQFKSVFSSIPVVEGGTARGIDTSDYSTSMQETPVYEYINKVEEAAQRLKDDMRNVERSSVSIPVIMPQSENMDFLRNYGANEIGDLPVIDIFDTSEIDSKLDIFFDMYKNRQANRNTGDEKALESLIRFIGVSTQTLTSAKMSCCTAILDYNNGLFANVLKSPYNNYSAKLEAETIEEIKAMNFNFADMTETYRPFKLKDSSLMKFDLYSNCWVDETGARSMVPFSMHQIQVDIFMPIISALMDENRIERRKIYEKVQDQKMGYLNKWHTETQDFYGRNRDTADQLKTNIIEALSSYNASYATWKAIKDTIEQMDKQQSLLAGDAQTEDMAASMILSSEQVNENFKRLEEDFESYMDRLQDDIDAKADAFGTVTFFEAYLYAAEAQKAVMANANVAKLGPRELKIANVSPYLAEYGTIPPQPNIEDEVMKSMSLNLVSEAENLIRDIHNGVSAEDEPVNGGSPTGGEVDEDSSVQRPSSECGDVSCSVDVAPERGEDGTPVNEEKPSDSDGVRSFPEVDGSDDETDGDTDVESSEDRED